MSAAHLNEVTLIGNLGADPEIKVFADGGRVANLSLATSEKWRDAASGADRERTEWHRVTVRGDGLIGVVERFTRKGSRLFVRGKLQTRKWQESDGRDRYTTEIVVAGYSAALKLLGDPRPAGPPASGGSMEGTGYGNPPAGSDFDDEIPF